MTGAMSELILALLVVKVVHTELLHIRGVIMIIMLMVLIIFWLGFQVVSAINTEHLIVRFDFTSARRSSRKTMEDDGKYPLQPGRTYQWNV